VGTKVRSVFRRVEDTSDYHGFSQTPVPKHSHEPLGLAGYPTGLDGDGVPGSSVHWCLFHQCFLDHASSARFNSAAMAPAGILVEDRLCEAAPGASWTWPSSTHRSGLPK